MHRKSGKGNLGKGRKRRERNGRGGKVRRGGGAGKVEEGAYAPQEVNLLTDSKSRLGKQEAILLHRNKRRKGDLE